jgi:RNA polymerase nonessential primary-like sigma factor
MNATSDYVDNSTASQSLYDSADEFREPSAIDLSLVRSDESGDVHIEGLDSEDHAKPRATRSTDLVRLYLQEIGRVSLLERDEEVAEAQCVQQHMELLALRNKAAEEVGGTLSTYVNLIHTRDQTFVRALGGDGEYSGERTQAYPNRREAPLGRNCEPKCR